jgi:hypothetical protein
MRFSGLDYAAFLKLLSGADCGGVQGKSAEVKLPRNYPVLPQHQTLYRAVKLLEGGNRAEYVFEPVSLERFMMSRFTVSRVKTVFGQLPDVSKQGKKCRQSWIR